MGRFVYTVEGNVGWEWKYAFAEQCSNFGYYAENYLDVPVYTSENDPDGEYIHIHLGKDILLERLTELIDELRKQMNTRCFHCPVCGERVCLEWTKEMFENFYETIKDSPDDIIDMLLYSEYI